MTLFTQPLPHAYYKELPDLDTYDWRQPHGSLSARATFPNSRESHEVIPACMSFQIRRQTQPLVKRSLNVQNIGQATHRIFRSTQTWYRDTAYEIWILEPRNHPWWNGIPFSCDDSAATAPARHLCLGHRQPSTPIKELSEG